jgi:hypothetical protein
MPITYTNRKGQTYHLCQGTTRTGKPRYYFALTPRETPVEKVPEGYQIQESVNALVTLAKPKPLLLLADETEAVRAAVQAHPQAKNYRIDIKPKQITIHETAATDVRNVATSFGVFMTTAMLGELQATVDAHASFLPIMRFLLEDSERRHFQAQRWCFRGSIDDWINIGRSGPIAQLVAEFVPILGTDDFFELF